jgi:periplasmic protein CpxP/Spy
MIPMKNLIVISLLLFCSTLIAQPISRRDGAQHSGKLKDATSEQLATLRAKKLRLELDLTQAQEDQIKTLETERIESMRAQRTDKKDRSALSTDEWVALKQERLNNAILHKQQLKSVLTPTQYEQWEKRKKRQMGRMKSHKKGTK